MRKRRKKFLVISAVVVGLLFIAALTISYCRTGKIGLDGVIHFSAKSWVCEYNNTSDRTSGSGGSSNRHCRGGNLLIINRSDEPLMEQVTQKVADAITKAKLFRKIKCVTGRQLADEPLVEPAPDFVLDLNLKDFDRSRKWLDIVYSGKVELFVGTGPFGMSTNRYVGINGFCASFNSSEALKFTAKLKGSGPGQSELDLVSNNISGNIAKSFIKPFEDMQRKNIVMPDYPAEFYGKGEASEPKAFAQMNAKCLMKVAGFLRHRESFWIIESKGDKAAMLDKLYTALVAEGYKKDHEPWKLKIGNSSYSAWSAEKGDEHIIVTDLKEKIPQRGFVWHDPKKEEVNRFGIMYSHWFTKDQLKAAIAAMVKAEPNVAYQKLLPFRNKYREVYLTDEQEQYVLTQMLAEEKDFSEPQCLLAAQYAYKLKNKEVGRRLLLRVLKTKGLLERDAIMNIARQYKDEEVLKHRVTEEALLNDGYKDLAGLKKGEKLEIKDSNVFKFYMKDKEGYLRIARYVLSPAGEKDKSDYSYQKKWKYYEPTGYQGSSSWSDNSGFWGQPDYLELRAQSYNDARNFQVTFKPTNKPGKYHCLVRPGKANATIVIPIPAEMK